MKGPMPIGNHALLVGLRQVLPKRSGCGPTQTSQLIADRSGSGGQAVVDATRRKRRF
jgi:hypothetical protein